MTDPGPASGDAPTGLLAAVGPYFAVRQGVPGEPPPAGLRPLRELYATGPGSALAERIPLVAERLGTAEPRVAASVLHLGLAARLWSVALGAAVLGAAVPDLHPDRTHAALPPQGPIDLWLPAAGPATRPASAVELRRVVVAENLVPLAAAVRSVTPVSEGLLWGNAASALAGALRVLHQHVCGTRPAAARAAHRFTDDLLALDPLADAGTLTCTGAAGPPAFRRTSCCLYYRVGPGAGICGDCVFDAPPARPARP
ncbi:(2Fe-2S)-binding protein [Kitasatospora sp. NBC_00315]|uniref:(2Fe-2S)-binding protein n=1 Tax=Kitasatospora sp. NBC_00315 TaxID=2975963 RepID=UPI00324345E3